MKKLLILVGAVALVSLTGCATSQVAGIAIASGEEAGGDIYANSKLKAVDPSVAGNSAQHQAATDMARVSSDLQLFVAGKLTQGELGAVTAQLNADKVGFGGNQEVVSDISSILNIFSQNFIGSSGIVTPQASLIQGNVQNIVTGINQSLQYWEGQWSVSNPSGWAAPKASL